MQYNFEHIRWLPHPQVASLQHNKWMLKTVYYWKDNSCSTWKCNWNVRKNTKNHKNKYLPLKDFTSTKALSIISRFLIFIKRFIYTIAAWEERIEDENKILYWYGGLERNIFIACPVITQTWRWWTILKRESVKLVKVHK